MSIRYSLTLLGLASVYFLAGKLGLKLAFVNASITAVWPPTGIAIAAFLILGNRVWPAILLGAFLVNITTAGSVLTSIGIASGNTLEGLVGAYLIRRLSDGIRIFEHPQGIFKYVLSAGMLSTAVSATIGVSSLVLTGYALWSQYPSIWLTWWLGDMGGALIVAPLLIIWMFNQNILWSRLKVLELILALVFLVFVGQLVFGDLWNLNAANFPLEFLTIPILVWIAFRFSPRETITAIFVLAIVSTIGTISGTGPFTRTITNESLLLLQLFLGTTFLTVMTLASAISERRLVEQNLLTSEERYRKLVETSPDAILVTDLEGKIETIDKQALLIYGFDSPSQMIGKSGFDFIAPEDQAKTRSALTKIMREGRVENLEYLTVRQDGSTFVASANASLFKDATGKPESIIVVVRDVTREKEIDRAKTEFVSLASHQLRTPTSIINWYTESLLRKLDNFDASQRRYLEEIYAASRRMAQLVNSLLDISRIELGTLAQKPTKFDLVELADQVLSELGLKFKDRKLNITKDYPQAKIEIIADPHLIRVIFENLLSNSIKYTPVDGSTRLGISQADQVILITVTDTGWGIPKTQQSKIFTKLFRADNVKLKDTQGSGLGLYLVKLIVERDGGKIWFKSEEGQGSTFYVQLPSSPIEKA